jgi:hypothetical protein
VTRIFPLSDRDQPFQIRACLKQPRGPPPRPGLGLLFVLCSISQSQRDREPIRAITAIVSVQLASAWRSTARHRRCPAIDRRQRKQEASARTPHSGSAAKARDGHGSPHQQTRWACRRDLGIHEAVAPRPMPAFARASPRPPYAVTRPMTVAVSR